MVRENKMSWRDVEKIEHPLSKEVIEGVRLVAGEKICKGDFYDLSYGWAATSLAGETVPDNSNHIFVRPPSHINRTR